MTQETGTRCWRAIKNGLYFETPGVYGADKIATFPTPEAARFHAGYLNALEACAEALEAIISENSPDGMSLADYDAGAASLARLKELRGE